MRLKNTSFVLFFYLLLTLLPLSLGLIYAFLYSIGAIGALSKGITWAHWISVFEDGIFLQSLWLSVKVALVSMFFSVVIALIMCMLGQKKQQQKTPFIWYLPLSVPPMIAAFLGFQFLGNSGVLSRFFYQLGILHSSDDFVPLINDYFHFGIILTQILMTFPYFYLLFLNIYEHEKIELFATLSSTLGASKQQIQRQVIAPILLQKARSNILLWTIFLVSAYEIPLFLGKQSPSMVSVLIGQKFKKFNIEEMPQAYAITVLYAVLTIGIILWTYRKRNKIG
jgi:putative spermidine/putrescine transport system permease protein